MKKKALVLAGGGSRGAYQIGVWQALQELDWNFDIVTGTSVGAINGAVIAMGDFDLAVDLWKQLETSNVFEVNSLEDAGSVSAIINEFLKKSIQEGGVGVAPLKKILEDCYDLDKIYSSSIDFGVMAVNFDQRKPTAVFAKDVYQKNENIIDYILASAAIYPAIKMYKIDGERYIDGGYYNNMPVDMAIERGATEIIAVDLESVGFQRNHKLDQASVRYIKPYWDLGNILLFDQNVAKRNIRLGYLDTMKLFEVYDGRAYTFIKNQFTKFYLEQKGQYRRVMDAIGFEETSPNFIQKVLKNKLDLKMRRHFKKKNQLKYNDKMALFFASEKVGEFFELNPEKIYSVAHFNELLLREYEKITVSQHFKEIDRTKRLKNIKKIFDKKVIVKLFTELILENLTENRPINLSYLSSVFPDELEAATYMAVLLFRKENVSH